MKYVIQLNYVFGGNAIVGNGSYIVAGEKYLVLCDLNDLSNARLYKTAESAKRAYKKILNGKQYVNAYQNYNIIEMK